MDQERQPATIDVVQDIACPWCRIGKANLQQALDAWDGPPVVIRYHPFLLNESIPAEGYDFLPYMSAKFGRQMDPGTAFAQVTEAGAAAGLDFRFERVEKAPNTLAAHRLIALTPAERQSELIDALYDAYFQDGRDVGDLDVLAEIAAGHGWKHDAARSALAADDGKAETLARVHGVSQSGISGVPFFIMNGRLALSGAQPPDVLLEALRESVAEPIGAGG